MEAPTLEAIPWPSPSSAAAEIANEPGWELSDLRLADGAVVLKVECGESAVQLSLYNSPFRNISRACVKGFFQSPLGRVDLEHVDMSGC